MLKTFCNPNTLEVGIDEAGRGPLFGRVYIGACILHPEDNNPLIKDSKKLTKRKLLMCYDYIKENAIDYTTVWMDEKIIDDINIFQATMNGMHKAIDNLIVKPEFILVDGDKFNTYFNKNNNKMINHLCVIGGDDTYTCIAGASILAKVERDRYIEELCKNNSELNLDEKYGLLSNKGYGTKKHINGIQTYGITKWHRKSFGICRKFL